MILGLNIGFLPITLWDVIDVLIVGYLFYQIYKLLRGSLAFNIFAGLILVYITWWLVDVLKMDLLALILGTIINTGVILFIIIFQPEVRRFLLFLGRNTFRRQISFINQTFGVNRKKFAGKLSEQKEKQIFEIVKAITKLSESKTGALILFSDSPNLQSFSNSGVVLDAKISSRLLESIFNKESPLHDGAVIINEGKIQAASCVLPVSDNPTLPENSGLRHRAAVGVTEDSDTVAFVVSEETGKISSARQGRLITGIPPEQVTKYLRQIFKEFYT